MNAHTPTPKDALLHSLRRERRVKNVERTARQQRDRIHALNKRNAQLRVENYRLSDALSQARTEGSILAAMNAYVPRVLAEQDVSIIGPDGHTTPAIAQAVQYDNDQILYLIPALGLTLTEGQALKLAGGIADLAQTAARIASSTLTSNDR